MPPRESDILSSYLLRPAPLSAITTYDQFRALFPKALSSATEPRLRSLWRDLQAQRDAVAQEVSAAIEEEARRGAVMRREVVRARRAAAAAAAAGGEGDGDAEVEMERALFGETSGAKSAKHTLTSIVPELDGAAAAVQAETDRLRDEEAALTEAIRQTVGGLSDLRHGKFANAQLRDEVVDGLVSLQDACERKS